MFLTGLVQDPSLFSVSVRVFKPLGTVCKQLSGNCSVHQRHCAETRLIGSYNVHFSQPRRSITQVAGQ